MKEIREVVVEPWDVMAVGVVLALGRLSAVMTAYVDSGGADQGGSDRERGDVPGWVLVTIMTAGLVTALWLVADGKLRQLFSDALDGVVGNAP